MNSGKRDPLEEALAGLPREVEPERDLWPEIEAKLRSEPRCADAPPPSPSPGDRGRESETFRSPVLRDSESQTFPSTVPGETGSEIFRSPVLLDGESQTSPSTVPGERGSEIFPSPVRRGRGWGEGNRWKLAASVLLVIGASITAYLLTGQDASQRAPQIVQEDTPAPALTVQPASFGSERLGAQYASARAELDRLFEERLTTLPPETRDKLRGSLTDMRRATQEISNILAEHPSDPLLQQLLLTSYQNELKLLADVTDMTAPSPRVDL